MHFANFTHMHTGGQADSTVQVEGWWSKSQVKRTIWVVRIKISYKI